MLEPKMVFTLFEAFSIERWNDLVRPFHPVEMDHAASKMFLVFIIGKYEEKKGVKLDWTKLITHSVFSLLQKIALSDIKAPIQYLIRTSYKSEYQKIKEWIFERKYKHLIDNDEVKSLFREFLFSSSEEDSIEARILKASHQASSLRELDMLSPCNEVFRIKDIRSSIKGELWDFVDLNGVKSFLQKGDAYKLITEIEKLRFQIRWNQSPRIPHTSVLGHSYFVALLTLLMCYDLNMSKDRLYTNFFCGLFHDLPEAVTRDIISPVKEATDGLPEIVKEIEKKAVEKELLPLIDESYRNEVLYYIQDEFENRIIKDGKVHIISDYKRLDAQYSAPSFKACDGRLVRFADHIAAFVEAERSINFGITSAQLESGYHNIITKYPVGSRINGLDVDRFFDQFRAN